MQTIVSCMGANFVAREVGYSLPGDWMLGDWGKGDRAANDYFRPLETYRERLETLLREIVQMGFGAIDLWTAHLNPQWATPEHVAIAQELLRQYQLTLVSYAGGFGSTVEEFASSCRVAAALGIPVLGGSASLLRHDRAALVSLLREYGLKFGFENHPAEKTAQDVLAQIGDQDQDIVGVTVDTGWFGTHGTDARQALQELGPRLFHVHLKDVVAVGGHETCRYGRGVVPVDACVTVLRQIGYNGAISVEHEAGDYDPTEDLRASRQMLLAWLAT